MEQYVYLFVKSDDLSEMDKAIVRLCPGWNRELGWIECFSVNMSLEYLDPPYDQEDFDEIDTSQFRFQLRFASLFPLEGSLAAIAFGLSELISRWLKTETAIYACEFDNYIGGHINGVFEDNDLKENLPGCFWQPFVL